jgi:hypothetical protein
VIQLLEKKEFLYLIQQLKFIFKKYDFNDQKKIALNNAFGKEVNRGK